MHVKNNCVLVLYVLVVRDWNYCYTVLRCVTCGFVILWFDSY